MDSDSIVSVPIFKLDSAFEEIEKPELHPKEEKVEEDVDLDVERIPVSLFLEELRHDDLTIRLNCVTRMRGVALSVGANNFRELILPLLIDMLEDDESLLALLAEQLGESIDYVGGKEFIPLLMKNLERLARLNNSEVQKRAVASLIRMIDYVDDDQLQKVFMPMVMRLARDEPNVVSRISACRIVVALYGKSPLEWRSLMRRLVVVLGIDDNPLVRYEIASNLGALTCVMHKTSVSDYLLPLHQHFCTSSFEEIKIAALNSTPAISEKLTSDVRETYVLTVIRDGIEDPSTEVRRTLTENLCQFLNTFHSDESLKFFVSGFNKLVYDCDPSLRSYTMLLLPEFVDRLPLFYRLTLIQDLILPNIHELLTDENVVVRKALATVISTFAKVLPEDRFISNMFPVLKKLFKDSSEKVRAEIISHFYEIATIIGIEDIRAHFYDALIVLGNDAKWIVRLAAIDFHTKFAMSLGFDYFESDYHVMFLRWLSDSVFVVREKCAQSLGELIKKFGYQSQLIIVPKVVSLSKSSNYLIRITCINLFKILLPLCSKDVNLQKILPTLAKLIQDPVANVRFNVAKAFKILASQVDDRFVGMFMRPGLVEIANDKDQDVRFFASETLEYIDAIGAPVEEE